MISRIAVLAVLSAAFSALLWLVSYTYLGDVLPLAAANAKTGSWRFQTTYLLTILILISAAVAFMAVLGLIALIGNRYLPKDPHNPT